MGTLQQLLNRDAALFDQMSAHQIYSLIQLVDASLFFSPCATTGGMMTDFLCSSTSSCFIISHAHLDHVNGLVLSAGSLSGPRKRVCASLTTLKSLETIFGDRIWPNLASWDADDAAYKLLYDPCVYMNSSSPALSRSFTHSYTNSSNSSPPNKKNQTQFQRGIQDDFSWRFCHDNARMSREERHARRLRILGLLHPTRFHRPRIPLLRRCIPRQPLRILKPTNNIRLARRSTQNTQHALDHLHRMFVAVRPVGRTPLRSP